MFLFSDELGRNLTKVGGSGKPWEASEAVETTSAAGPEGPVNPLKMSSFRSGRLNPGASNGKTGLPFDKLKSLAEKIDRCGHYIKSVLLFCFLFFIIYVSLLLQ